MMSLDSVLMQAVIVRPLSSVAALVRFVEEPQLFAIEFNDGCPIHVSCLWISLII
jgi:DnaJ family protein C protein 13